VSQEETGERGSVAKHEGHQEKRWVTLTGPKKQAGRKKGAQKNKEGSQHGTRRKNGGKGRIVVSGSVTQKGGQPS